MVRYRRVSAPLFTCFPHPRGDGPASGCAGSGGRKFSPPAWGWSVDIPGFCKSATIEEVTTHGFVLTPGRYVGAEDVEDDGEPFEEKMSRLVGELNGQFAESAKLEQAIKANLSGLGYGG